MKRILLLVCVLPCLLSAQNTKVKIKLKDKTSIQQVLSKSLSAEKLNQVRTLAGINENLPDSVYAYNDEEKTELIRKTHFTYNAEGYPTEEIRINYQFDWVTGEYVPDYQYKTVYTYTINDGKLTVEEITYEFYDDEEIWGLDEKMIYVFNLSDLVNPVEICSYWWADYIDDWITEIHFIAVEFDDENRPTVYEMEYTDYDEDDNEIQAKLRIEITYENGLMKSSSMLDSTGDPEDPWSLIMKEVYTFNDDYQLVEAVSEYSDGYTITYLYKYDEKGNESYMKFIYENEEYGGYDFEEFYDNYYPDSEGDEDEDEDEDEDNFYYTEAFDGTYLGDMTLTISKFPLDPAIVNLEMSGVTLEISEGTLLFLEIPILKIGDPVTVGFDNVLFNQDGNIQAPDVITSELGGFPLIFSIIKSSSAVTGDEIVLTMRIVDGETGMVADIGVIFTGLKQDPSSKNHTILEAERKIVGYYNFSGQKLAREPEIGLYIILYDNGSSKKVMKLR